MPATSKRKNTLPEGTLALELLKKKIRRGDFAPGESVRESLLAREFGLNRNSVRFALNQIVAMNVFEYVPFCGYKAKKINIRSLIQWYELRVAIEPAACRRLALRRPEAVIAQLKEYNLCEEKEAPLPDDSDALKIDSRTYYDFMFHHTIVSSCGNAFFAQIQDSILLMLPFFRFGGFEKMLAPAQDSVNADTIKAHNQIISAIENGDAAAAEKECQVHIECLLDRVVNLFAYL